MSSWDISWVNTDHQGQHIKYHCAKHGEIGRDIVIFSKTNSSPASNALCHRCLVSFLNTKFTVKPL